MRPIPLILVVLLGSLASGAVMAREDAPQIFADGRFSGFDAQEYVRQSHPELGPDAEAISHWAAYYLINPMLLTRVVRARFNGAAPGTEAVRQLALSLISESGDEPGSNDSKYGLRTQQLQRIAHSSGLSVDGADALLDGVAAETQAAGLPLPHEARDTPPALDLPFARPQAWQFNGVHTWTGDEDGTPMSSLDFTRSWTLRWGGNTASDQITAAHDGEVSVYSSCFVQVRHESGWATRYYHLDTLQVINGQTVRAGEPLGIYSNSREQALCSGGNSTGPHLHFALLKNGNYFSLENVALSGYVITPGDFSYDSASDRMWLEKRGDRYFAFNQSIGIEEGDNQIDYRYNGMWAFVNHAGHGLNIEITEFNSGESSRKTVFVVIYTYDDNGLANFYVGNIDFERWRSDESMPIDLLQTAGGNFTNLADIDFNDPDQVNSAGSALLRFVDCDRAVLEFDLVERSSAQATPHSIELSKLIGVPKHVCQAASVPLPQPVMSN